MQSRFRFAVIISIFLIMAVLVAGCSSDTPADTTVPVVTSAPEAKYVAGDIIARSSSATDTRLYVILRYDTIDDEYTRAWIYKNSDGTWGHRIDDSAENVARSIVDKVYPVKISHVTLSAVPIVTTTIPTAVQTTSSLSAPVITSVSPTSAGKDTTVGITVNGDNFLDGATVKLIQPGYPPVSASTVSVSSVKKIECSFNLKGVDKGHVSILVTNPDGQTGILESGFIISEPAPIISGVLPIKAAAGTSNHLTITGQYFKDPVKITLTRNSVEIVCLDSAYSDVTKVTCTLEIPVDTATGSWNLTVLNIADRSSGTWNYPFTVTSAT